MVVSPTNDRRHTDNLSVLCLVRTSTVRCFPRLLFAVDDRGRELQKEGRFGFVSVYYLLVRSIAHDHNNATQSPDSTRDSLTQRCFTQMQLFRCICKRDSSACKPIQGTV